MTERERVVVDCSDSPSMTKQSFREDADINVLVARFKAGQEQPPPPGRALYGDFTKVGDYLEAMTKVAEANSQFEQLTSSVRSRFRNDPAELLAFCDDPANAEEGVQLGLFEAPGLPPLEPAPIEVVVVGEEDPNPET